MGNLYAESALKPTNLQNTYEKKLGFSDTAYTQAVDNGTYTNFVKDSAGYGLAQWTHWSRKQALLAYALTGQEIHQRPLYAVGVHVERVAGLYQCHEDAESRKINPRSV